MGIHKKDKQSINCCSVLNPRAKKDFAKYIFEIIFYNDSSKIEEMTKVVKNVLNELYNTYNTMCSMPSICSESVLSSSYNGTHSFPPITTEVSLVEVANGKDDDTLWIARSCFGYTKNVCVQNEGKKVASKVEKYLFNAVEILSNVKLNVLLWWKMNRSKYPILENFARDVLAVLISMVVFEFFYLALCVVLLMSVRVLWLILLLRHWYVPNIGCNLKFLPILSGTFKKRLRNKYFIWSCKNVSFFS